MKPSSCNLGFYCLTINYLTFILIFCNISFFYDAKIWLVTFDASKKHLNFFACKTFDFTKILLKLPCFIQQRIASFKTYASSKEHLNLLSNIWSVVDYVETFVLSIKQLIDLIEHMNGKSYVCVKLAFDLNFSVWLNSSTTYRIAEILSR